MHAKVTIEIILVFLETFLFNATNKPIKNATIVAMIDIIKRMPGTLGAGTPIRSLYFLNLRICR